MYNIGPGVGKDLSGIIPRYTIYLYYILLVNSYGNEFQKASTVEIAIIEIKPFWSFVTLTRKWISNPIDAERMSLTPLSIFNRQVERGLDNSISLSLSLF